MEKAEVDFDEMFRCLGDHLEYVDIGRLKEALMELAEQIEGKYPMSLDTKTGLVDAHCLRSQPDCGKGRFHRESAPRGNCAEVSRGIPGSAKICSAGRAEIPHDFSDDEMANIISILMQIQE